MINTYEITRIAKNVYLVKRGDEIVKECSTYTEAQNFLFTIQTEELLNGQLQVA